MTTVNATYLLKWETSGPLGVLEFDAVVAENHRVAAEVTKHPIEEGAALADHVKPGPKMVSLEAVITNTPINATTLHDQQWQALAVKGSPRSISLLGRNNLRVAYAKVTGGESGYPLLNKLNTAVSKVPGGPALPTKVPGLTRPYKEPVATAGRYADFAYVVGGSSFQMDSYDDRVKLCHELLVGLLTSSTQLNLITPLQEYDSMVLTSVGSPVRAEDAIRFQLEFEEIRFAHTENVDVIKRTPEKKRAAAAEYTGPAARVPQGPPDQGSSITLDLTEGFGESAAQAIQ